MANAIEILNSKASYLADLRRNRDRIELIIKQKKAEYDAKFQQEMAKELEQLSGLAGKVEETQAFILKEMNKTNLMSWKNADATITRKVDTKYRVTDRDALILSLAEKNLAAKYTHLELNREVESLFGKEELAGVEAYERDYISVLVKKVEQKSEVNNGKAIQSN